MEIKHTELEELIVSQISSFCDDNDIELTEINNNTRLIGSNAIFDSMGLVTFLVELEEKIDELYSVEIEIADEKAMSRRRSPFLNVDSLAKFLSEKIHEA